MRIPESLPLHSESLRDFGKLQANDLRASFEMMNRSLDQTLDQIMESVDAFLNTSTDIAELLKDHLKTAFTTLMVQEQDILSHSGALENAKRQYRDASESLPNLTVELWDKYASGEVPDVPRLSQLFKEQSTDTQNLLFNQQSYAYGLIEGIPRIMDDPTCVIPELDSRTYPTEDDLEIAGGRITLVCPITCRPYENPMVSKLCGHVFDQAGIESYLEGHQERDCPQDACNKVVKLSSFKPDPVMKLRSKVAKFQETQNKSQRVIGEVL